MSRAVPIVLAAFAATILFGGWAAALVAIRWLVPGGAPSGPGTPWPLATPWWVPTLLWLGINALALWLVRRRLGAAPASVPAPISPTWRAPTTGTPPRIPPSLNALLRPSRTVEAVAFARDEEGSWRARTLTATECRRLRVFLDYAPVGGLEPARGPARVELATLEDVATGRDIDLAVVEPDGAGWRFAGLEGGPLEPQPLYRCRLSFAADDRESQSVYFVVPPLDETARPLIVDEGAFRYRDAWEAEAPLSQPPRWRGR